MRRVIVSTPASTEGRGRKLPAETFRASPNSNHGHHCAVIMVVLPTAARLRATSHCTSSTADVHPGPCSSLRRIAVVR